MPAKARTVRKACFVTPDRNELQLLGLQMLLLRGTIVNPPINRTPVPFWGHHSNSKQFVPYRPQNVTPVLKGLVGPVVYLKTFIFNHF